MIASMAAVGLGTLSSSGKTTPPPVDVEPSGSPEAENAMNWPDGPAATIDGTKQYVATLGTNKGQIKIQLSTDTPKTVNSFAFLAGNGFYNDNEFFFVSKKLGAVAGDPTCKADGSQVCSGLGGPGYTLDLENQSQPHEQWSVVAPYVSEGEARMHGSQFRILYGADSRLDGKETVFGKVVQGQDILQSLADTDCVGTDASKCAGSTLVIQDVSVAPAT